MSKGTFDVFLSYGKNDKTAAELLARKLTQRGLNPWLDKWNLVPGVAWQSEVELALSECRSCAVLVGRSGIGPWQGEEMRAAIQRRVTNAPDEFRVIPVLLPSAKRNGNGGLPSFLGATTWVEFEHDLDDEEALHRLVSGIRGMAPGPDQGRNEPQTEWILVLSATVDDVTKPVAEAILAHLREISGDVTLTITKSTRGSVRIGLVGSTAGFRKIQALANAGQLTAILGMRILDILPNQTIRVLVADDHELIRRGLVAILGRAHPDWHVTTVATGKAAIEAATARPPDVVILDLSMPDLTGPEVAVRLKQSIPGIRILILTAYPISLIRRQLQQENVNGYLGKNEAPSMLVHALERILAGEKFFGADSDAKDVELPEHVPDHFKLTVRELEVLRLLASGKSNQQLATELSLSVRTVESHRARILEKLNVDSVTELVRIAIRDSLA